MSGTAAIQVQSTVPDEENTVNPRRRVLFECEGLGFGSGRFGIGGVRSRGRSRISLGGWSRVFGARLWGYPRLGSLRGRFGFPRSGFDFPRGRFWCSNLWPNGFSFDRGFVCCWWGACAVGAIGFTRRILSIDRAVRSASSTGAARRRLRLRRNRRARARREWAGRGGLG